MVVGGAIAGHRTGLAPEVVGNGRDACRAGRSGGVHRDGVSRTGLAPIAIGRHHPCRVAQGCVVGSGGGVGVGPGRADDRGVAEQGAAGVDLHHFARGQRSADGAAEAQGGVVGAAASGDHALNDADVVVDGGDCGRCGWRPGVEADAGKGCCTEASGGDASQVDRSVVVAWCSGAVDAEAVGRSTDRSRAVANH